MRLIDSLRLHLEPARPGMDLDLIAPVDGSGHSRHCRPLNRKKRLVDLRPGEHVLHCGKIYRIRGVEPHRWHNVNEIPATDKHSRADDFLTFGNSS